MSFNTRGYEIVRNVISKDALDLMVSQFKMIRFIDALYKGINLSDWEHDQFVSSDPQVEKSFSMYSVHCFEALALNVKPIVEQATGKSLYPAYTYARIYYNGAEMAIHKDRPSCQYSITMCISHDGTPWEIFMEDYQGNTNELLLNPGDMCIYNGTELNHWRVPYKGTEQVQAFLHYVDSNGIYADFKYDKRPFMGLPAESKE